MSIKYTHDHEWVLLNGNLLTVGITNYAQEQLGEVVYVELPETGQDLTLGEEAAVVESVKAAGEIKTPASGAVVETNSTLADAPETVNDDPMGEGWFYRIQISNPAELEDLMDENAYLEFLSTLE